MSDEELTYLITEAISDSTCKGWNNRIGAAAVLTSLRAANVLPVWRGIDTAPHACHVLAAYFDWDCGEWVMQFISSPPPAPYTHWCIPTPPEN